MTKPRPPDPPLRSALYGGLRRLEGHVGVEVGEVQRRRQLVLGLETGTASPGRLPAKVCTWRTALESVLVPGRTLELAAQGTLSAIVSGVAASSPSMRQANPSARSPLPNRSAASSSTGESASVRNGNPAVGAELPGAHVRGTGSGDVLEPPPESPLWFGDRDPRPGNSDGHTVLIFPPP
jgi:hypothetical protein